MTPPPYARLRVLLVEDNDDHAEIVEALLEDASDPAVDLVRAATAAEAVDALRAARAEGEPFGAVLTDQSLPDSEYWETVPRIVGAAGEAGGGPPVVALTAIGDLDVALEALAQGAQDYVVKTELTTEVLQRSLRYAVERARHAADLRATNDALRRTLDQVRQMQAQIVEQEKLAGLGRLLGGVAHELTNPLHLVLNYAREVEARAADVTERLRAEDGSEVAALLADLTANAQTIVSHARRSDRAIRSMVEHARGVAGPLREVDLARVSEVVVQQLAERFPDLPVEVCAEVDLRIYGVGSALTRMVYNVAENAALATRQPGASVPPAVNLRLRARGVAGGDPTVEVEVEDSGPGITPEALPHVFEPFFTAWAAPTGGLGLGLSLAHNIVVGHGGRIEAGRAEAGGACIRVSLPVGAPAVGVADAEARGAAG